MSKLQRFQDPKFWITFFTMLAALGLLELSEEEMKELAQAFVLVVGAGIYLVARAIERFGDKQAEVVVAQQRGLVTDFIERQDHMQAAANKDAYALGHLLRRQDQLEERLRQLEAKRHDEEIGKVQG